MFESIIASLYFILPAYFANSCPVIARSLKLPLEIPISQKHLGAHKTYRGIYSGYLGALLVLFIQAKTALPEYSLLNYSEINIYLYAFLFGFAAIFGDMTKSFFKRKVGIKPGGMWFPFDQLDFIIMVLIFLSPFYTLPWQNILILLILTPPLHFVTNLTAYFIGMKRVWW